MRLIMYSAVCTETARDACLNCMVKILQHLKAGLNWVSSHMPPGEMAAVIRAKERPSPRR